MGRMPGSAGRALKHIGPASDSPPVDRVKTLLGALAALALLVLAWRSAASALASDEERLRIALQDMAEGFDAASVRAALARVHDDYRDRETGRERGDLADGLRALFFQSFGSDPVTYRVELPPAEIDVAVDEDGRGARVALRAVFTRTSHGRSELWWDARAVTRWTSEGGRWRMIESLEVNHRDRGR